MTGRVITIDGPAGAGKTTVSRELARRLGWIYVDTGALYRGVAFEILTRAVDWENDDALSALLDGLDLGFVMSGDGPELTSSGRNIHGCIRTPEVTMLASAASARPQVRQALLGIQRGIADTRDAVFEGRDMGTVVFPDALCKFFLVADLDIRAERRHTEQGTGGQALDEVRRQIARRDADDTGRKAAPLKAASDAVTIDSSRLTPDQVVDLMVRHVRKAGI